MARRIVTLIHLGVLLVPGRALAQQPAVYERLPDTVDVDRRYVIYLHGRIIEEEGRRPVHPTFGVYEYDGVLEALAAHGSIVVSEQRASGTDMDAFAAKVADQVRTLLASDVPPQRISVVGFSKGGGIAIRTAALLRNDEINFVFLAACGSGNFSDWDISVRGRILSVLEASDQIGRSCAGLFEKPGSGGEHTEVTIDTGAQHGAFYTPHSEWLNPVLRWIEGRSGEPG